MTELRDDLLRDLLRNGGALPPASGGNSDPIENPAPRRPLYLLLLGEPEDINDTIKNLHQRGFAEAGSWSKIIPCPNATEAIAQLASNPQTARWLSILIRYFTG